MCVLEFEEAELGGLVNGVDPKRSRLTISDGVKELGGVG